MLVKLEALGCNKAIVGLVVPTGYSFNLDGTCIYLTTAVTGGGFITLAATLGATGKIPVASIALLLGIDRFMSEARECQ